MKPTREQVLSVLSGMRRAGLLSADGPTSLFFGDRPRAERRLATQIVAQVTGERVLVRTSRLPFAKPMSFSLRELDAQAPGDDE